MCVVYIHLFHVCIGSALGVNVFVPFLVGSSHCISLEPDRSEDISDICQHLVAGIDYVLLTGFNYL